MAARPHDAFTARNAPNHDIQERSDQEAEHGGDGDQRNKGMHVCRLVARTEKAQDGAPTPSRHDASRLYSIDTS